MAGIQRVSECRERLIKSKAQRSVITIFHTEINSTDPSFAPPITMVTIALSEKTCSFLGRLEKK